jgi:serine protease AprX
MRPGIISFFLCFILVSTSFVSNAQTDVHKTYLIKFTDKNNSPYSLSNPQAFLSQKALDRRTNMNISLDETDIPVNPDYLDSLRNLGAIVRFTSKWLNTATISVDTELVVKQILDLPFVSNSERVFRSARVNEEHGFSSVLTNAFDTDPAYGKAYNQLKMLNGHMLHEKGYNGKNVLIAVIDAGFSKVDSLSAFDHLFTENRIIACRDFVDGDSFVFDHHSHGMFVLSTIAGRIWGKLIGTAPEADFVLLRSENGDSEFIIEEDAWIAAAEFADSIGVDVINSSLGYSVFNDTNMNHAWEDYDGNTIRVSRGADFAAAKGIIVVNSAGNEGNDPWLHITAPGDADSILTIGAVDENRNYAEFSSIGPSYDGDVKPNVVAQGMNAVVATQADGIVGFINGTSLSSPIVAGMVACLVQAFPEKSNMEIIRAIEKSAHLYPTPNAYYGYGIPDFDLAFRYLEMTENNEVTDIDLMQLYPNPFQRGLILTLFAKENKVVTVRINSLLGQQVYMNDYSIPALGLEKVFIQLENDLNPGIYLLTITDGKNKIERKVIRMK